MGVVFVKADNLNFTILFELAGVMLETEIGAFGRSNVRADTIEAPDNGTVSTVNLINRISAVRGYEVVAVSVFIDAVDVKIVPSVGGVVARSSLARVNREDSLCSG